MTVMIVGATGFIGSAVAHGLAQAGAQVVGVSRGRPRTALPMRHVALDIARAVEPGAWTPLLAGIDAVVYCAGTLQDSPGESLRAVHETGPAALFAACARAGVRRVVHLSALGVERSATPFSGSKRAGDRALMESDLDWVILRPSVVIGADAFGGAALLRGLAALPMLPVPAGAALLQVVALDDLVRTVLFFVAREAPARLVLDLVGPRAWPLAALVAAFRRWLGWQPARTFILPSWMAAGAFAFGDVMGWLGWRTAIRSNAGRELLEAPAGDATAWRQATGIEPADIEQTLMAQPASVQERWFAGLYLLRPVLFAICALFWIATGIVALGPGWRYGIGLMHEGGVFGWPAAAAVVAGALCDIVVGLAIAWRRTARWGVVAGLVVTFVYAIVGTVLVPRLWIDPMGPLLKVGPILALHLAALAIVEDR